MFNEILKLLLEKPETIKGLFIKFFRLVLSLLIASKSYEWLLGSYKLINYLSIADWYEFVFSGRVLIVTAFFIVCDYLAFNTFKDILIGLISSISRILTYKGNGKDERDYIIKALSYFKYIEYDSTSKKYHAGINILALESMLEYITSIEGKSDLKELKNSYLNNIVHTYFVFSIVFFVYYNQKEFSHLNPYIYIIAIIFLVFYLLLGFVISYSERNASELLKGIKYLRLAKSLKEAYIKYKIYSESKPNKPKALIRRNNANVLIYWLHLDRFLNDSDIEFKLGEDKERKIVIITNTELTVSANLNVFILRYLIVVS